MSKGGAFHQADLLDGRIRRLGERRRRQIEAVESAFDADLRVMLQSVQPWLRAMVQEAIAKDSTQSRLSADIAAALLELDPQERQSEPPEALALAPKPPYPTMPRLPTGVLRPALDDQPLDGNADWGLDDAAPTPAPSEPRYPEPGEAAVVLPNGEIIAAGSGP